MPKRKYGQGFQPDPALDELELMFWRDENAGDADLPSDGVEGMGGVEYYFGRNPYGRYESNNLGEFKKNLAAQWRRGLNLRKLVFGKKEDFGDTDSEFINISKILTAQTKKYKRQIHTLELRRYIPDAKSFTKLMKALPLKALEIEHQPKPRYTWESDRPSMMAYDSDFLKAIKQANLEKISIRNIPTEEISKNLKKFGQIFSESPNLERMEVEFVGEIGTEIADSLIGALHSLDASKEKKKGKRGVYLTLATGAGVLDAIARQTVDSKKGSAIQCVGTIESEGWEENSADPDAIRNMFPNL